LKLKILLATVLALLLNITFADPVSGRITVTVRGNGPDVLLVPGHSAENSRPPDDVAPDGALSVGGW
jgi:hypothetical protein